MNIYTFTGILVAAWFAVKAISSYFEHRDIDRQRAENDQKQIAYQANVAKLEQEIADAKLTFDINKRKLDSYTDKPSN